MQSTPWKIDLQREVRDRRDGGSMPPHFGTLYDLFNRFIGSHCLDSRDKIIGLRELSRACCRDAFVADYRHTRKEHFEVLLRHYFRLRRNINLPHEDILEWQKPSVDSFYEDSAFMSVSNSLIEVGQGFQEMESVPSWRWSCRHPTYSVDLSTRETEATIAPLAYISSGAIIWIDHPSMKISSKIRNRLIPHIFPEKKSLYCAARLMPDRSPIKKSLNRLSKDRPFHVGLSFENEDTRIAITSGLFNADVLESSGDVKIGDKVYRLSDEEAIIVRKNGAHLSLVGKAGLMRDSFPTPGDLETSHIQRRRGLLFLDYSALRGLCRPLARSA